MKAIALKEFSQLNEKEQKRIIDACNKAVNDEYYKRIDEETVKTQIIWIKLAMINLFQCGITAEKIVEFLGSWKTMYRKNTRIKTHEEQCAWIGGKLEEIFGDTDFVDKYIEELKRC